MKLTPSEKKQVKELSGNPGYSFHYCPKHGFLAKEVVSGGVGCPHCNGKRYPKQEKKIIDILSFKQP